MKSFASAFKLNSACKIALVYGLVGSGWIVGSDWIINNLITDKVTLSHAQYLKGIFYVLVTMLVVYLLTKKAITSIRKQEGKLELLAKNTLDVIWSLDMDCHVTYVNEAIEPLIGWPSPEVIGKHIRNFCTQKSFSQLEEIIEEEVIRAGESCGVTIESNLIHRSGGEVPVEIRCKVVFDQHKKPLCIQGVTRDLKERYALQTQLRQAQKMQSIGTVASGVAHEVNNPISVISTTAESLSMNEQFGEQERLQLNRIVEQAGQVHKIVGNMLGFAREEQETTFSTFNPRVPLEKTIELTRSTLRHDQIDLQVTMEEFPPDVTGDPLQIQQVLLNLVNNAQDTLNEKYPERNPEKILQLHLQSLGNKGIRYSVKDFGMGISPEQQKKVFDPFYTTKPKGKGTGLGLWVIHEIVKKHHGKIKLFSEEAVFTQFDIDLPVLQYNEKVPTSPLLPAYSLEA